MFQKTVKMQPKRQKETIKTETKVKKRLNEEFIKLVK